MSCGKPNFVFDESNFASSKSEIVIGKSKEFIVNLPSDQNSRFEVIGENIVKTEISFNKSVVTITALKIGSTKIYLYSNDGLENIFYITVVYEQFNVYISSLEVVNGSNDTFWINDYESVENLSAKTGKENIATVTVDENTGLVMITAVLIGKTNLVLKASNRVEKTIPITVIDVTATIEFEGENEIVMNSAETFTDFKVTNWESLTDLTIYTDVRIVSTTVLAEGVVQIYGIVAGETTVRVKAKGAVSIEIKVTVLDYIEIDEATPVPDTLEVGKEAGLNISYYSHYLGEITVTSSSDEIATAVYSEGLITIKGVAPGDVTIKVEATYQIEPLEISLTIVETVE